MVRKKPTCIMPVLTFLSEIGSEGIAEIDFKTA